MVNLTALSPLSSGQLALRLLCALAASSIIGWEREDQNKPAGWRTNLLVGFGSALMLLVPIQVGAVQQSIEVLGRALQGVMTGVGFVGAGTVFRRDRVHGLTSAAALWVSAALSMAAACGLFGLSLAGAGVAWLVLRVFDRLEKRL